MPRRPLRESNRALKFKLCDIRDLSLKSGQTYGKKGSQKAIKFHIRTLLSRVENRKASWEILKTMCAECHTY